MNRMRVQRLHWMGYGAALLLSIASSGYTTVGEKDFACPGRPPGVRCMRATEVYSATENGDVVDPTATHALGSNPNVVPVKNLKSKRSSSKPQPHEHGGESAHPRDPQLLLTAATPLPAIDKPIPIRTPAQVMRAWVAPWEDERGVLHAGGYNFIEIQSRRWMFGETSIDTEPVRFFSIQAPARPTAGAAADAKESGGKDSASTARPSNERTQKSNASTMPKRGDSK